MKEARIESNFAITVWLKMGALARYVYAFDYALNLINMMQEKDKTR